ncbi:MAG: hypothetical protein CMC79_05470 [Flavobacteriaceae bacterium]|nr:hypothetical protein [Flavobacteriaceae bacterium]
MFIRNYLKTILLILPITIYGQINNTPIDVPLKLSGTFGEVRSTHFHGGLDIKTKGKQGVKVYSINDGYVNRIRVSTKGYGKSLYIIHPDGITSIYGHLKRFSPKIEGYIKNIQYLNETFEIQNFPKPNLLKISSGELIGLSGNTGSSTGPHLHFELRNSKTQNPINPLRYGIKIFDTIPPKINSLYLYKVKNNGSYEFIEKMKIQKKNDSLYLASKVLKYGNLGLGINFYI